MADPSINPNIPTDTIPSPPVAPLALSTLLLHADEVVNTADTTDVAPALHVSTTFRYPRDPDALNPERVPDTNGSTAPPTGPADAHIYSRATAPNSTRLERQLTAILGAPTLTYSSGLAAFHALLVHLHPRVVAIGAGYHGCHGVLALYQRLSGCRIVELHDESTWQGDGEGNPWSLGKGDLVHVETPLNPSGTASNLAAFAEKARARGAWLSVDATFAPPPLQDPFAFGADYVMHSGTKYFGGHSDMLCGVLAVGRGREGWEGRWWRLFEDRIYLGAVLGNMEAWLGVRSLRTLELRVRRQSETAQRLVDWLVGCLAEGEGAGGEEAEAVRKVVARVEHASLQKEDMHWLLKQMPNGFGPVFGVHARTERLARRLPSKLELFAHATSLGGVESLIEWRKMSDDKVAPELWRISVGVEAFEDLKADLLNGFRALIAEGSA